MDRKEFIRKWLNGTLTHEEKSSFEESLDTESLMKLYESLMFYKSHGYHLDSNNTPRLNQGIPSRVFIMPVAVFLSVVLVVTVSLNFVYQELLEHKTTFIESVIDKKKDVRLPDESLVTLSKGSQLQFNHKDWRLSKNVNLIGEAYFQVAKGGQFDVITSDGKISVRGTSFNVKQWQGYFEVTCVEGKLDVTTNKTNLHVQAGEMIRNIDGEISVLKDLKVSEPAWISGESSFRSVPFYLVIKELERQYDLSITTVNVDVERPFSGRFDNNNLDLALKSITIPLKLQYDQSGDGQITLRSSN